METAKNRRRLMVLTALLVLAFVGLGCRLVDIQLHRHQEFARTAEEQHGHIYYREAPRGDIRDRRGNLLATSIPVKRICADPSLLREHSSDIAGFVAPLLGTNATALLNAFSRTRTNSAGEIVPAQYVVLRNKVPVEEWEKVRAALTNHHAAISAERKLTRKQQRELWLAWHRGIYTEEDQIRNYPNGHLASHILGFTGYRDVVIKGRTNSVMAGMEGIEATLDDKLHGARGWVKTETDSARRELFVFREQDVDSRPGLNAVLTIDARVQQIIEEELQTVMARHFPKSASAIVVRPKTGEILGMASLPSFDPNQVGKYKDPWYRRNRLITDTFEPGSTFKTIVLAGALNDNTVRLTDTIDCENGYFFFAGYPLRDHEHYGEISVEKIIAKSSNIGTAKVAMRMGAPRAYQYIRDFGFGQRTGIPLGGESPGILPQLKDWKPIHITRIPIGQGVAATPLQMAMGMAAVANGGVLMRPMLIDSIVDEHGRTVAKYHPTVVRRAIDEHAAKLMVSALRTVVERGTADKAALEHYTVAGKTGTAQKVVNRRYSHEKYFSSFAGFFPADQPELCVYVALDEPLPRTGYYGGQCAAPAFRRISERIANYLNIKPDVLPEVEDALVEKSTGPVIPVRGRL